MKNLQKLLNLFVLFSAGFCLFACSENDTSTAKQTSPKPVSRFLLASDLHYYSADLGTETEAFRNRENVYSKLVRESTYIIKAFVDQIKSEPEKFVIICGDLTENGELYNHQSLVKQLDELRNAGKKVFVLPGNHDINNPNAISFSGGVGEKIPSVTPEEFSSIYANFGYKDAFSSDANSLSYAAFPDSVTMLIALDDCRYDENTATTTFSGGHLRSGTLLWLDSILSSDAANGRNILTRIL